MIVNPTHIAVAIEYDEQIMNAPRLAAKGQLQMAKRIVEIAKKHQVPVIRNIPLARSLFTLELDQEVPEDLYEAVAEILNFVAKLENTNEESITSTRNMRFRALISHPRRSNRGKTMISKVRRIAAIPVSYPLLLRVDGNSFSA